MARTPRPPATAAQAGVDSKMDLGNVKPGPSDMSAIDAGLDEEMGPEGGGGLDEGTRPAPPADTDLKPEAPASGAEPNINDPPARDISPPAAPVAKTPPGQQPTPPQPAKTLTQPIPPNAPKPVVQPTPPIEPRKLDSEIDAIKDPVNASPEALNSFKAMREVSKKFKTEAETYRTQNETLKTQIVEAQKLQGKLTPEVEARVQKADEIIRAFDISNDSVFKQKFDSKMDKTEASIYDLLRKTDIGEENIKKLIDVKAVRETANDWWQDQIIEKLLKSGSVSDNEVGAAIKSKLTEFRQLNFDKNEEIANASKSGSEFMKKRVETFMAKEKDDFQRMDKTLKEIQEKFPFAKLQEIPSDATPEQKAQIEEDNEFYKQSEKDFNMMLNPPTPEVRIQTVVMALAANRLWAQNEKAGKIMEAQHQKVLALEERISKLTNAGRTNDLGKGAPPVGDAPKSTNRLVMKNEDAIEAGLREVGA